eukprot:m51a1_g12921 putative guanine nucleotide-binding protein (586) ;mRNA; r:689-3179
MGKKSKRVSAGKRYSVEKKVRRVQAQRKRDERRKSRKSPDARRKLRKDPGIPNLWPWKEDLLQSMEVQRAKIIEERQRKAESNKRARSTPGPSDVQLATAGAREQEFERREEEMRAAAIKDGEISAIAQDHSRRQFYKKFRQVIESADVLLEVLDARDPMSCRCAEAEQLANQAGKRVVLVLNKIDLVPRDIASRWVSRLRDEHPTVAFKASTQRGGSVSQQAVGSAQKAPEDLIQATSNCLGAEQLMQLLKNYCRTGAGASAKSITVGVIGYPNVGKSSLINSLKRTRAVGVSATPGSTRDVSEVKIDKNIRLLDSPGVVFADADANKSPLLSAASVRMSDKSIDASSRAEPLIARAPRAQLLAAYKIPEFDSPAEFLSALARRRGKVLKGGIPDVEAAARIVLGDVAGGRLPYWVEPPQRGDGVMLEAAIVDSAAGPADSILSELPENPEFASVEEPMDDGEEKEGMEVDDGQVAPEPEKKKRKKEPRPEEIPDVEGDPETNATRNKDLRKRLKKEKKQQRKGKKIADVAGGPEEDEEEGMQDEEEQEAEAGPAPKGKKGAKGAKKADSYDFMTDFYSGSSAF